MSTRLRQIRKSKGLKQVDLAALAHTTQQQITRLEKGERKMSFDWARRLATALQIEPADLLDDEVRTVAISGYVGAGARIVPFDSHEPGDGLYRVACPKGLDPDRTEGLEVRGDSMWPIDEGWLVFYTRGVAPVPSDIVNRLCVVEIASDRSRLLKRVRKGYTWGKFNLVSTNADPIDDVELSAAARVVAILAPEMVERMEDDVAQEPPSKVPSNVAPAESAERLIVIPPQIRGLGLIKVSHDLRTMVVETYERIRSSGGEARAIVAVKALMAVLPRHEEEAHEARMARVRKREKAT